MAEYTASERRKSRPNILMLLFTMILTMESVSSVPMIIPTIIISLESLKVHIMSPKELIPTKTTRYVISSSKVFESVELPTLSSFLVLYMRLPHADKSTPTAKYTAKTIVRPVSSSPYLKSIFSIGL